MKKVERTKWFSDAKTFEPRVMAAAAIVLLTSLSAPTFGQSGAVSDCSGLDCLHPGMPGNWHQRILGYLNYATPSGVIPPVPGLPNPALLGGVTPPVPGLHNPALLGGVISPVPGLPNPALLGGVIPPVPGLPNPALLGGLISSVRGIPGPAMLGGLVPLLLGAPTPATLAGQIPPGLGLPNPALQMKFKAGMESKLQQDWAGVARHLTDALNEYDVFEKAEPKKIGMFSLQRFHALIDLGDALNHLNRPEEALPYLIIAEQIDQDAAQDSSARGGKKTYQDTASALTSLFAVAKSASSNLNRSVIFETDDEHVAESWERGLEDKLPPVTLPVISLMESYARLGRRQEMEDLFQASFKPYLNRHREKSRPDVRDDWALEAACVRMAIALARVGRSPEADEAFACAMEYGSKNAQINMIAKSFFEALAARRRFLLGSYVTYVLGTTATNAEDASSRNLSLLANVAESKGASNRYRSRVRSIWMNSQDKDVLKVRAALVQHEQKFLELPTHGDEGTIATVQWVNEEARLMKGLMPALLRNGLEDAFKPGESIVQMAQSRLDVSGSNAPSGEHLGEVLIGFSFYRPIDFQTQELKPMRVMRYVVSGDLIDLRDIGSAREIELLAGKWRGDVLSKKAGRRKSAVPGLSDRLLGDLPPQTGLARDWVIDPDGIVSLLPFEALDLPKSMGGVPVIQRHRVRYVASIAEYAFPSTKAPIDSGGTQTALVVADPIFSKIGSQEVASSLRGFVAASGVRMEKLQLQPLPDTRQEAVAVSTSLERMGIRASVRLGEQATVAAFDFQSAPTYLHVATHGLYLSPSVQQGKKVGAYGIRKAQILPGLQSALGLTPDEGGGFLTGAQLAGLNLAGTELVVLSACDTGNGAVEVGEGVVSLRRAIEDAGARSSITSLWPVPSGATASFMADFYARLANGESKLEALHQVKLARLKSSVDPIQWAGFLLAGEP